MPFYFFEYRLLGLTPVEGFDWYELAFLVLIYLLRVLRTIVVIWGLENDLSLIGEQLAIY